MVKDDKGRIGKTENRINMIRYPSYRRIHFIGIGGIGMSGIAEVLLNLGYEVTGSDIKESEVTKRLEQLGARIFKGHSPENLGSADVVVFSSAIRDDNPELQAAKERAGLPVIPRAEMLAELMRMKHSILIAGAHGKTTTTSIVGTVLHEAGIDPTVVIGGRLNSWGTNAKLGKGDFFVAEADESDGTFLKLSPSIAVVTNIDREHMDYYKDLDHIIDAFADFVNRVPFYGLAVVCIDNVYIREKLLPRIKRRYITYGFNDDAEIRADDFRLNGMGSSYNLFINGSLIGRIKLNVPGKHNVQNSLAAVGVAFELGLNFEEISRGIARFSGVQRRLQVKGEKDGIIVIDDYGHHPTEIEAVLETLAMCYPGRRIVVVFQPHRYTRSFALQNEFSMCFGRCHLLFVTEIYAAGEKPISGITGSRLAQLIEPNTEAEVCFCGSEEELMQKLLHNTKDGDILVTLGAGNIWRIGENFLKLLDDK